jgi:hypothetical protein
MIVTPHRLNNGAPDGSSMTTVLPLIIIAAFPGVADFQIFLTGILPGTTR